MEKHGIIERAVTEWQSPVILVKNRNGEFRFAVDYRKLNAVTVPQSYPLPRMDDVFDTLGNANVRLFSVVDMASGFWQVPVNSSSQDKTGFVTHEGVWRFKKLPFGLINSPATFAMVLAKALNGINWKFAMTYVDDIIIFSSDFNQHLRHLQLLFQKLREANLKIKPTKCDFAADNVTYLGHVITEDGNKVDQKKVEAVRDFPVPKNESQLRSFLGLCQYYRRFVFGFSHLSGPLNNLLKKSEKFVWTDECQKSFEKLKEHLITAPVLAYPYMNQPFILTSDASGHAVGYILSQKDHEGVEHPIAYDGRSLQNLERTFSISERECLAVLEGIRAFHPYLAHSTFTVVTDHS